jgi:hypothetical protein
VPDFGRIEFTSGGGALAQHLIVRDGVDPGRSPFAELLAGAPSGCLGPAEPP